MSTDCALGVQSQQRWHARWSTQSSDRADAPAGPYRWSGFADSDPCVRCVDTEVRGATHPIRHAPRYWRSTRGATSNQELLPKREHDTLTNVRIIARRALREFWERHPDAQQPLRAWYHDAKKADWRSPADIKRVYANASIVGDDRVVFNIKGNQYRMVVAINYPYRMCYIRFIGSHQAYDRIDVMSV